MTFHLKQIETCLCHLSYSIFCKFPSMWHLDLARRGNVPRGIRYAHLSWDIICIGPASGRKANQAPVLTKRIEFDKQRFRKLPRGR